MAQVSGLVIRIDDGETLHQVGVAIDVFGQGLRDMTGLWERMTTALEAWQTDAFDTEGSSNGARFVPLSPKYKAWKEKVRPGRTILKFNGDMYEALTESSSPFAMREVSSDKMSFTFGTRDLDYPGYHVTGISGGIGGGAWSAADAAFGVGGLPRRNPFVPNAELEVAMSRVLQWHGRDAARKAKLSYTSRPGDYVEFTGEGSDG